MSPVINERVKTSCPNCLEQRSSVLEIRRSKIGLRRRMQCGHCGHRFSTFELTEKMYKEFAEALEFKKKALKLIGPLLDRHVEENSSSEFDIKCFGCLHYRKNICDYEFPEAGTEEADECNWFDPRDNDEN